MALLLQDEISVECFDRVHWLTPRRLFPSFHGSLGSWKSVMVSLIVLGLYHPSPLLWCDKLLMTVKMKDLRKHVKIASVSLVIAIYAKILKT